MDEPKFKVGDVVECTFDSGSYLTNGQYYEIVYADKGGSVVDVVSPTCDRYYSCWVGRFKLKEKSEPTVEQLVQEILRMDTRIGEAKKDIENAEQERKALLGKLREKGLTFFEEVTGKGLVEERVCSPNNVHVGDTLILNKTSPGRVILAGEEVEVVGKACNHFQLAVMNTLNTTFAWVNYADVGFKGEPRL